MAKHRHPDRDGDTGTNSHYRGKHSTEKREQRSALDELGAGFAIVDPQNPNRNFRHPDNYKRPNDTN